MSEQAEQGGAVFSVEGVGGTSEGEDTGGLGGKYWEKN